VQRRALVLATLAIAAAAIVAVATYFHSAPGTSGPASLTGRAAPSFTVPSLDGSQSSVAAYRGRIVLLNLWATWCPPCRAEMPDLQRFYQRYARSGVTVIGVDQGESGSRASQFARSLGIRYPILLDRSQQYGAVYAAAGLPTTIVIDRAGTIRAAFDGPLSFDQMAAAVSSLLQPRS